VYDSAKAKFVGDFEMIGGGEGDAGEELKISSWIEDINGDGIPELMTSAGVTVLEPDASEEERITTIDPLKILSFSLTSHQFIETEVDPVKRDELEKKYRVGF
jgi:hypothetical protein